MKVILTAAALSSLMAGVASAAVDMESAAHLTANDDDLQPRDAIYQPTDYEIGRQLAEIWC